jgi:hypothetical protein
MLNNKPFTLHDHYNITHDVTKLLNNQEHKCYICNTNIELNKHDIILTPCNHLYHYECMYFTFYQNSLNPRKKHKVANIRECPYCRQFVEPLLPIFKINDFPLNYYINYKYDNIITCNAILKTGKNKGNSCGCKVKHLLNNVNKNTSLYCKRHKNYVNPNDFMNNPCFICVDN